MLERCGAATVDDLYIHVPEELRLKEAYNVGKALSEPELDRYFAALAADNKPLVCFAGAGYYHHYTPAAIGSILARSEFLTAYTPYQPEISQGTLQYIFEYQSMMASLTGLDVSNASMYDGTTATAEAMVMAVAAGRKKRRVLISATMNPAVLQVMATYAKGQGIILEVIPEHEGATDLTLLDSMLEAGDVAGVVVAQPNYYGILEDFEGVAEKCHARKALFIMNCHASTLGVLRSPGEWGVDIACGEAQSLGMPLNYGGPYLGYLCCREPLMRKLPGRIVGATTDRNGNRSFVLTLQAREQHIRREKATSNICSNQGIMTLFAAMYLSVMGPQGLREVNELSYGGAHALAAKAVATGKAELTYPDAPFLNEFALTLKDECAEMFLARAAEAGILAGVKLGHNTILVAVTEMRTPEEIEKFVSLL